MSLGCRCPDHWDSLEQGNQNKFYDRYVLLFGSLQSECTTAHLWIPNNTIKLTLAQTAVGSVRATLRQCHYYNQRYSREGELTGSEHTGTLTQWLSSEIKLRSAYCVR